MKFTAVVFYNQTSRFGEWKPGHAMVAVAVTQVEASSFEGAAEILFAKMNRGSGREDNDLLEGNRSMSVGDVVRLRCSETGEMERLACERFGFRRIGEDELQGGLTIQAAQA